MYFGLLGLQEESRDSRKCIKAPKGNWPAKGSLMIMVIDKLKIHWVRSCLPCCFRCLECSYIDAVRRPHSQRILKWPQTYTFGWRKGRGKGALECISRSRRQWLESVIDALYPCIGDQGVLKCALYVAGSPLRKSSILSLLGIVFFVLWFSMKLCFNFIIVTLNVVQ